MIMEIRLDVLIVCNKQVIHVQMYWIKFHSVVEIRSGKDMNNVIMVIKLAA